MRKKINIAAKALTGLIIFAAAVLTAIILVKSDSEMSKNFAKATQEIGLTLNLFIVGTYIVLGLTTLLVIVFAITNMLLKPKSAINALIGIGAMAIILIVAYVLSTPDIDPVFVRNISENIEVTDALSRQVGTGLIATYILAALSVLAIVYAWISNLIKG